MLKNISILGKYVSMPPYTYCNSFDKIKQTNNCWSSGETGSLINTAGGN